MDFLKDQHMFVPGDLLAFKRGWYTHWALFLGHFEGEAYVIHLWNPDSELNCDKVKVMINRLIEVEGTAILSNHVYDKKYRPLQPEETLARAMSMLGKGNYNVAANNCEHFVTWARYGVKHSRQVRRWTSKLGAFLSATVGFFVSHLPLPYASTAVMGHRLYSYVGLVAHHFIGKYREHAAQRSIRAGCLNLEFSETIKRQADVALDVRLPRYRLLLAGVTMPSCALSFFSRVKRCIIYEREEECDTVLTTLKRVQTLRLAY